MRSIVYHMSILWHLQTVQILPNMLQNSFSWESDSFIHKQLKISLSKNQGIALYKMRILTRRQTTWKKKKKKKEYKQQIIRMFDTGMYATLVTNVSWVLIAGVFDLKKSHWFHYFWGAYQCLWKICRLSNLYQHLATTTKNGSMYPPPLTLSRYCLNSDGLTEQHGQSIIYSAPHLSWVFG